MKTKTLMSGKRKREREREGEKGTVEQMVECFSSSISPKLTRRVGTVNTEYIGG